MSWWTSLYANGNNYWNKYWDSDKYKGETEQGESSTPADGDSKGESKSKVTSDDVFCFLEMIGKQNLCTLHDHGKDNTDSTLDTGKENDHVDQGPNNPVDPNEPADPSDSASATLTCPDGVSQDYKDAVETTLAAISANPQLIGVESLDNVEKIESAGKGKHEFANHEKLIITKKDSTSVTVYVNKSNADEDNKADFIIQTKAQNSSVADTEQRQNNFYEITGEGATITAEKTKTTIVYENNKGIRLIYTLEDRELTNPIFKKGDNQLSLEEAREEWGDTGFPEGAVPENWEVSEDEGATPPSNPGNENPYNKTDERGSYRVTADNTDPSTGKGTITKEYQDENGNVFTVVETIEAGGKVTKEVITQKLNGTTIITTNDITYKGNEKIVKTKSIEEKSASGTKVTNFTYSDSKKTMTAKVEEKDANGNKIRESEIVLSTERMANVSEDEILSNCFEAAGLKGVTGQINVANIKSGTIKEYNSNGNLESTYTLSTSDEKNSKGHLVIEKKDKNGNLIHAVYVKRNGEASTSGNNNGGYNIKTENVNYDPDGDGKAFKATLDQYYNADGSDRYATYSYKNDDKYNVIDKYENGNLTKTTKTKTTTETNGNKETKTTTTIEIVGDTTTTTKVKKVKENGKTKTTTTTEIKKGDTTTTTIDKPGEKDTTVVKVNGKVTSISSKDNAEIAKQLGISEKIVNELDIDDGNKYEITQSEVTAADSEFKGWTKTTIKGNGKEFVVYKNPNTNTSRDYMVQEVGVQVEDRDGTKDTSGAYPTTTGNINTYWQIDKDGVLKATGYTESTKSKNGETIIRRYKVSSDGTKGDWKSTKRDYGEYYTEYTKSKDTTTTKWINESDDKAYKIEQTKGTGDSKNTITVEKSNNNFKVTINGETFTYKKEGGKWIGYTEAGNKVTAGDNENTVQELIKELV